MEKQWSEMTWQERREERFKKWLTPAAPISPAMEKLYKERLTRMIKAIKMEIPDRVPMHLAANSFVAYNNGHTLYDVLYDYSLIKPDWIKFLEDYEQDSADAPGFFAAKVYELLDYKVNAWPGHGLPKTSTMHNFVEKEYMQADEYDLFMKDPFDFGLRKFTPRTWGAFEPLANIPSLSSYSGLPERLMMMCQDPNFKKLFKAVMQASDENVKHQKVMMECAQESLKRGFPPLMGGVMLAPFDTVADMLRGTSGVVKDMFRQPQKLLESLEVIAENSIKSTVGMVNMARSPIVFVPMHKGADSFMSVPQFEKFYWPTFRKLILGVVNEGCVPMMIIDGSYNEARLKIISELPKSCVIWTMEKTDMALSKKILGNSACIAGNVTAAMLYTQTPEKIKEYAKWLIETCAPGGGYILALGSGIDKCDPKNLHAVVEAGLEYGYYK